MNFGLFSSEKERVFKDGWHQDAINMSDYLDRIGSGFILLNPDPLDFDYIPEEMVGREIIQQNLAGKFHSIAHPNGSANVVITCLLYTSPSPRDRSVSRMPSSA